MPQSDGEGYFSDCESCQRTNPAGTGVRENWHCGFVPTATWKSWDKRRPAELRVFEPWESDYCPGYTVRAPAITEAARACFWSEKGQLEIAYPLGVPQPVFEAVEVATQANNHYQSQQLKRNGHD